MSPAAMPELAGVTHRYVDVGGLRVHVAEAGRGEPLVLLHGWPQHWWCWHGVIPGLAEAGFRVLAPDLRGCGWTDAPADGPYNKEQLATDVLALLDVLGIERAQLVGHDWGGWTAQLVALRAPERVSRLCLINIAPVVAPTGAMLRNGWRFLYQPLNAAPWLGAALARSSAAQLFYPGVPPKQRQRYVEVLQQPANAHAGSLYYRTFLTSEILPSLQGRYRGQHLQPPLLVLHGVEDPVIRPSMVEGFRALARDSTIHYVEGSGHFLADERPELVTERLLGFLARP